MIKMHIDRIRSQSIQNPVPAPGHTGDISSKFNGIQHASARYSIGKKIDAFQMKLNRVGKIPGPGQYKTADHLTGCEANGLADSRRRRSHVARFGTATDRFRQPKPQGAPLANYSAMDNFNQAVFSQYGRSKRCVMGSEAGAGAFWNPRVSKIKEAVHEPGPGAYATTFSDFDQ